MPTTNSTAPAFLRAWPLHALRWLPWVACAAGLLALGWRMIDGLTLRPFDDEWETILGAQVLGAGGRLYREFVNIHGPFIFMASQVYGAVFGWDHANNARLIPAALITLAGATIALSPGLRGVARPLSVALFAGWLATVWLRQALYMLNYFPLGGALAGIALAGFVIPAWRGARCPAPLAFIAGVALALLAGTAVSYWPSVVLFVLSGVLPAWQQTDYRAAAWCGAGLLGGGLATLVYLLTYGSVPGFLAFHIGQSQANLAAYLGFSFAGFLRSLMPGGSPDALVQAFALLCTFGGVVLFVALDVHQWRLRLTQIAAILVGGLGVLLLNARGVVIFQNGTFVVAALVLATLAAGHALSLMARRSAVLLSVGVLALVPIAELALRSAPFTPWGVDGASLARTERWRSSRPSDAPAFARIREVTRPDERILILVFHPGFYVAAGRLPMDGFYTYFPWDADYARAPWFGQKRDICISLAESPPPVITYDDWHVWGYDPHVYMPCLFDILKAHYGPPEQAPGLGQIYVRRDRLKP